MKRAFTFRLARVARIREVLEDQARNDFTTALSQLRTIESRCDRLRAEIDLGSQSLAATQEQSRLDVSGILARERTLVVLLQELTKTRQDAERARIEADQKRTAWQARNTERRALDELSKRHKQRHLVNVARADNADADEVASQRFSHSES